MGMNYIPKWHLIGHFAVVGMEEYKWGISANLFLCGRD